MMLDYVDSGLIPVDDKLGRDILFVSKLDNLTEVFLLHVNSSSERLILALVDPRHFTNFIFLH